MEISICIRRNKPSIEYKSGAELDLRKMLNMAPVRSTYGKDDPPARREARRDLAFSELRVRSVDRIWSG
jgi:hypothetical protein